MRFIDPDVPLHVIVRAFQGQHLLRPCVKLNGIVYGVIGRALQLYKHVRLYAKAFMSNHIHLMLQGPPAQVPAFMAYVTREISRRWARQPGVDWEGTMFHKYIFAALPTAASQIGCLKYVLSQGTKEGLVASPFEWPGVNSARELCDGTETVGRWVDYTSFSRAVDAQRGKKAPERPKPDDFILEYAVRLTKIPAWAELGDAQYARAVLNLVRTIENEALIEANGRKPMGADNVRLIPLHRRSKLPKQPWFAKRGRLICWAARDAPETQAHHANYWAFQSAFSEARDYEKRTGLPALYPLGAFTPGRLVTKESLEQLAA